MDWWDDWSDWTDYVGPWALPILFGPVFGLGSTMLAPTPLLQEPYAQLAWWIFPVLTGAGSWFVSQFMSQGRVWSFFGGVLGGLLFLLGRGGL
jgi:hypothetical protein